MERFKIFLLTVDSSRNGTYECQAELQGRNVTTAKPYLLRVKELPHPKLSIESKWKVFYPTEKVTLKCSIDEDSNEWGYEWFRNGNQLHEDISSSGNTLSISSAKAIQSGQYTCRGKHLTRPTVTTNQTEAVQLRIQDDTPKPTITKHQWFEFFYTEERVQLHCNMPGDGWEYHWHKDSNPLTTNPELTINSTSVNDTGVYHCKAQRGDFSVDSETVQVRVQNGTPKPNITKHKWFKFFYTEEQVQLHCNMPGDGWEYHWHKDSNPLTTNPALTINSTSVSDTGDFHCKAKRGDFSVDSETVQVRVQNNTPKPNITKHVWFELLYTDEQVQLHCEMQGVGWEYHWYKGLNFRITNPTHTINSTTVADTGDYYCKAQRGDFSVDSETVQVRVEGVKERATEDLFFSMKDSNNQIVSPMKEYMDDIPIELEECQETEELITDHASAIHEDGVIEDEETPASESNGLTSFKGVKDTAPEDLVLSVTDSKNQAVSPIKDIDNSPTELEDKEKPASEANGLTSFKVPTSAPQNLSVEDVNDTSVTLKWRSPENIGSGLDGYTVEYCKEGSSEWVVANKELITSNRIVISGLTTGDLLNIRVVAVNAGGRSEPVSLAQPVTVREVVDRPKIRLPRALRSRYVKHVGEQINVVIPFVGKPKPVISWTKDGQPLDTKKVNIRNSDKDSILFIRKSEREDSGNYEMTVKVDSFEDKASLIIQIVDLPGPPASVKLVDSWGFNAALEWTPPKDNGNTEITGYTIQKADKKTGVSIVYKPLEYKEHDFSEAPKFTAPLSDRAATVGYTTKLLCAVRGSPKPKIEWLKNQMLIGDDPKYRQINNQGVCSLEIRKPSSFDGGVYTCRAKNALGEATVACKLEVKHNTPRPIITKHQWFEFFYTEERVQLNCNMPGVGWEYYWYKDSKLRITNPELTIDSASVTDTGDYHCKAQRGDFSVDSETVQVRVQNPPKAKLTVDSKWTEFFPNEVVTLQCEIEGGSSGWTFQWKRDAWIYKETENTRVLPITVKHSESGEYSCAGKLNDTVTSQQSNTFMLNVRDNTPEPTITKLAWFEFFYTEERVQLNCNMPGDGWEYHWYKDSKLRITNPELTIDSASVTDTGVYHCKAQRGDFSVDSETVQVQVQNTTPKSHITKHEWFEPFYTEERVQLHCNIPGDGWEYHWHKDLNPLTTNPEFTINSASVSDSGVYQCKAQRGDFSVDSETVQVQVEDTTPKSHITKHEWFEPFYTEERVQLHCNIPGDGWEYHWHKDLNPLTTNPEFTINSASVSDSGVYQCKAQRGDFSVDSETVQVQVEVFKRKILLAISGCLVCCIVILIIGCIVLKITRKPAEAKETAPEDLFFSMTDSKNQTVSPMKEYMDNKPTELEECKEKEELITDHASPVHEDGVIKVQQIEDFDNVLSCMSITQSKKSIIIKDDSHNFYLKDEETPASEANGMKSFTDTTFE
ncbi:myosin-binding H-like protein [Labeo rohita]|uniref:Myosin-binding H-like protein n=2 Tax=Labeonini TaxID=2743697 RepID=A0A498LB44_LABRO|nr:myosin-binding H-like protein [Labeo rohita]